MFWDYSRGSIQSVSIIALISPKHSRARSGDLSVSRSIDRPSDFTTARIWRGRSTRTSRRGSSKRRDRARSVLIWRRRSRKSHGYRWSSDRGVLGDYERLVCRSSAECAHVTIGGNRADGRESESRKSTPCPRQRPSLRAHCRRTVCSLASPPRYLQIKSETGLKEASEETQYARCGVGKGWKGWEEEASLSNFLPSAFRVSFRPLHEVESLVQTELSQL